jgi:hypothetical protein
MHLQFLPTVTLKAITPEYMSKIYKEELFEKKDQIVSRLRKMALAGDFIGLCYLIGNIVHKLKNTQFIKECYYNK